MSYLAAEIICFKTVNKTHSCILQ